MEQRKIAILSYEHEGSTDLYNLDSLGEEFELSVPPENVLMALCAHHEARLLIESGIEASIVTIGGCAVSNMRIVERINEITQQYVPVEANDSSNSIASNIESLSEYKTPFVIICQKFARLRTRIHSRYHLGKGRFQVEDWETYVQENQLTDFERDLLNELDGIRHVPLQRKLVEGVLIALAFLDPKNGFTTQIAFLRSRLRKLNPRGNIFNKSGLS